MGKQSCSNALGLPLFFDVNTDPYQSSFHRVFVLQIHPYTLVEPLLRLILLTMEPGCHRLALKVLEIPKCLVGHPVGGKSERPVDPHEDEILENPIMHLVVGKTQGLKLLTPTAQIRLTDRNHSNLLPPAQLGLSMGLEDRFQSEHFDDPHMDLRGIWQRRESGPKTAPKNGWQTTRGVEQFRMGMLSYTSSAPRSRHAPDLGLQVLRRRLARRQSQEHLGFSTR